MAARSFCGILLKTSSGPSSGSDSQPRRSDVVLYQGTTSVVPMTTLFHRESVLTDNTLISHVRSATTGAAPREVAIERAGHHHHRRCSPVYRLRRLLYAVPAETRGTGSDLRRRFHRH